MMEKNKKNIKKKSSKLIVSIENFFITITRAISSLGSYFIFVFKTLISIFKLPFPIRETLKQAVKVGYESIGVTILTNFLMGSVLALQVGITLETMMSGASSNIGGLGGAFVTEVCPVLTAIIVAGKSGSAMAASIGTMKITEQIDALITLSTDPIQYISVPRLLASLFVMPVLIIVADFTSIVGAFIIATTFFQQSMKSFMLPLTSFTTVTFILHGIWKAIIFGAIISTLSTYIGFNTTGGAEGVGKSTTSAVVFSSVGIILADLVYVAVTQFL